MAFPHFSFCIAFWLFTGVGLACCIRRYPVEIAYFLPVCLLLIVWPYNEIRYWTHVFPFALLFFLKGMEWAVEYGGACWGKRAFAVVSGLLCVNMLCNVATVVKAEAPVYSCLNPDIE